MQYFQERKTAKEDKAVRRSDRWIGFVRRETAHFLNRHADSKHGVEKTKIYNSSRNISKSSAFAAMAWCIGMQQKERLIDACLWWPTDF